MACPSPELAELIVQQMHERDAFVCEQRGRRLSKVWTAVRDVAQLPARVPELQPDEQIDRFSTCMRVHVKRTFPDEFAVSDWEDLLAQRKRESAALTRPVSRLSSKDQSQCAARDDLLGVISQREAELRATSKSARPPRRSFRDMPLWASLSKALSRSKRRGSR